MGKPKATAARPRRTLADVVVMLLLVGFVLSGGESPAGPPEPAGDNSQELATLVVLLTVDGAGPRYPREVAADAVFGHDSLAWRVREESAGRRTLSGDPEHGVLGPVDVPRGESECDRAGWAAAAASSLPDLRAYDVVIYVVAGADCDAYGRPGRPAAVWVDWLGAHELLETLAAALGAGRSGLVECAPTGDAVMEISLPDDCRLADGAGSRWSRSTVAELGWLDESAVHTVQDSRVFDLACPEAGGAAPQILRIPRGQSGTFWDVVRPCDTSGDIAPGRVGAWLVGLRGRAPLRLHANADPGIWEGETLVDREYDVAITLVRDGTGMTPAKVFVALDGRVPDVRAPAPPTGVTVQPMPSGELRIAWQPVRPPWGTELFYRVTVTVVGDRPITLRSANGAWEEHDAPISVSLPHIRVLGARPGDRITVDVEAYLTNGPRSQKTRITATVPVD